MLSVTECSVLPKVLPLFNFIVHALSACKKKHINLESIQEIEFDLRQFQRLESAKRDIHAILMRPAEIGLHIHPTNHNCVSANSAAGIFAPDIQPCKNTVPVNTKTQPLHAMNMPAESLTPKRKKNIPFILYRPYLTQLFYPAHNKYKYPTLYAKTQKIHLIKRQLFVIVCDISDYGIRRFLKRIQLRMPSQSQKEDS